MNISVFDLFSVGIGPSSSHTVGPMKAAREFVLGLELNQVQRVVVELFGSLAFTGKGHGTDKAILLGLEGHAPDTINPDIIATRAAEIIEQRKILLLNKHSVPFQVSTDLIFNFNDLLPTHTNGMRFTAFSAEEQLLLTQIFYSIGGGFIIHENAALALSDTPIPYPFSNARELLAHCN